MTSDRRVLTALGCGLAAACIGATAAPAELLAPWSGPYGGVPPFERVRVQDIAPAMRQGVAQARADHRAIAANPAAPTFDNTIAALERAGRPLDRAWRIYSLWAGSMSSPQMQRIERELAPELAAYEDEIGQDAQVFARIDAVFRSPEFKALTAEQQRLVQLTRDARLRQGAGLDDAAKKRLAEINQQLATLTTTFSQNLLADEEEVVWVDRRERLAGLPQAQIDAAAALAAQRRAEAAKAAAPATGAGGKASGASRQPGAGPKAAGWAIANTRSAVEPLLTYGTDRALREQVWRLFVLRGEHPDAADPHHARDNGPVAERILALRAERAKILGFPSYAHWRLADTMAREPARAMELLMKVWAPSVSAARRDIGEMQAIADAEGRGLRLEPWDHRFYAEKLRKARFDFDERDLRPYLELETVRKAMFWLAGELYGLRFEPVRGVPVFDRHMSVYAVHTREGRVAGLWYFDPLARRGKSSGAWMNAYRLQGRFDGPVIPLVSNNCNFIAGKPGEPVQLSWDDTVTMFHEFGHALHGLLSDVTYESLAGPNSLLDFVEMPSQINERWLLTPQVLARLVDRRGRAVPPALVERLKAARAFNEGFFVTEYLASAIVDLKLHMSNEPAAALASAEKELTALGLPPQIVMRHRIPQFGHIFDGADGYAAGYYAYQWAEVLDRDAFEAFVETGDPFDRATAKRLVDTLISVGNSVEPGEAFRRFRGRDPSVEPLLKAHGFTAAPALPAASAAEGGASVPR